MAGPDRARADLDRGTGKDLSRVPCPVLQEDTNCLEQGPGRLADGSARHAPCSRSSARCSRTSAAWSRKPSPDFSGATEAFETLRAVSFSQHYGAAAEDPSRPAQGHGHLEHRAGPGAGRRSASRAPKRCARELFHRMRAFLEQLRIPALPGQPAAAVPGGRGIPDRDRRREARQLPGLDEELLLHHHHQPSGDLGAGGLHGRRKPLPVGLQIVGRYRDDFGVLQLAHAFEQETGVWRQRPSIATA